MPLELLERDEVLASVMPGHGDPTGGDEAPPDDESEDDVPAEPTTGGDGA